MTTYIGELLPEDELLISGLEIQARIAAHHASGEAGYEVPPDSTVAGKAAERLKGLLSARPSSPAPVQGGQAVTRLLDLVDELNDACDAEHDGVGHSGRGSLDVLADLGPACLAARAALSAKPPVQSVPAGLDERALKAVYRKAEEVCGAPLSPEAKERVQLFTATYLAALASAPAPEEWQPIETAPKDGTPILMINALVPTQIGVGMLTQWGEGVLRWDWGWATDPTHWLPLPAPPQGEQG